MENEITVRAKCSINEIISLLASKSFKMEDKFTVIDTYYISNGLNLNNLTINEMPKEYILLRNIKQYYGKNFNNFYKEFKITYKYKEISTNGDIINQRKYDCLIKKLKEGKNLLKALGYKRLFDIKENTVVYSKDNIKIEIKNIEDKEILLELEANRKLNTINKLKQEIKKLDIPIDESNFFIKKAEIKLKDLLGEKND